MSDTSASDGNDSDRNGDSATEQNRIPSPLNALLESQLDDTYAKLRNTTLIAAAFFALLALTGEVTRTIFGDIAFPAGPAKNLFVATAFIAILWLVLSLWQAANESTRRWVAKWETAEDATERNFLTKYSELQDSIKRTLEDEQTEKDKAEIERRENELRRLDSQEKELRRVASEKSENSSTDEDDKALRKIALAKRGIETDIANLEMKVKDVEDSTFLELAEKFETEGINTRNHRRVLMRAAVMESMEESNRAIFSAPAQAFEKLSSFREYIEFTNIRDAHLRKGRVAKYLAPLFVTVLAISSWLLLAWYKGVDPPKLPGIAQVIEAESRIWRSTLPELLSPQNPSHNAVVWSATAPGDLTLAFPLFINWKDEEVSFGRDDGEAQFSSFAGQFVEQLAACATARGSSSVKAIELELVGYADSKVSDPQKSESLLENLKLADRRAMNFEEEITKHLAGRGLVSLAKNGEENEAKKLILSRKQWSADLEIHQETSIHERHSEMLLRSGFIDYESESKGRLGRRVDLVVRNAGYCEPSGLLSKVENVL